jgi:hypothetical protein
MYIIDMEDTTMTSTEYRGATPKLNGKPVAIKHEQTDGDGNATYTTADGTRCAGEFVSVGGQHELHLTAKGGMKLDWTFNGDTISVTSEPRGLTFARRTPNGGQQAYDVCILREAGETDDQIINRYKAGLDQRLIREAV